MKVEVRRKCGDVQRKAEMNGRLRRMTIADIPLRACREFPSFKLPVAPDWRGYIGSLCWPRAKEQTVCPVGLGKLAASILARYGAGKVVQGKAWNTL